MSFVWKAIGLLCIGLLLYSATTFVSQDYICNHSINILELALKNTMGSDKESLCQSYWQKREQLSFMFKK